MSEQLQLWRGTAAQVATFTGASGEVAVDTTNNRLVVQDGATAGGWPQAGASRVAVSNTNYSLAEPYAIIAYTSLTAARTVFLPASAGYPTGQPLLIVDESGECSATNTITVAANGTDTINGAASAVISMPYGFLVLESNAGGKWTIIDQATQNLTQVSIGTEFDPNNVLSVDGASALFNGSTGFNVTVNKGATSDTASFIFEDGFSGRAQIGLCGDDNFHFKVSPNGSTFNTGILIDATTGAVTLGNARTAVNDAAYTVLTTDRLIAFTAISAARIVSLPASSAYPPGLQLTIADESGSCSASKTISVTANGTDAINGASSVVISKPYGFVALESNGSGKWTLVEQQGALAIQSSGNTNTSSSGSGAFVTMTPNFALPANFLQSGKAVRITACFSITTGSAPPTLAIELLAGSTVIASLAAATPTASVTNVQYGVQFVLQAVAAPSSSSNCQCSPVGQSNGYSSGTGQVSATAMPVSLATNAAMTLQMATEWSAAGTGTNSITLTQFIVESIN
jgi:hypothetical protein